MGCVLEAETSNALMTEGKHGSYCLHWRRHSIECPLSIACRLQGFYADVSRSFIGTILIQALCHVSIGTECLVEYYMEIFHYDLSSSDSGACNWQAQAGPIHPVVCLSVIIKMVSHLNYHCRMAMIQK